MYVCVCVCKHMYINADQAELNFLLFTLHRSSRLIYYYKYTGAIKAEQAELNFVLFIRLHKPLDFMDKRPDDSMRR
jgi:hypothetical protein